MLATLIVWGHPSGTPAPQIAPYTHEAGPPPRRLSEAQAYATFNSGASCEGNGAGSITTLADCSAAAAALGLSDTTAEDDGQDGYEYFTAQLSSLRCESSIERNSGLLCCMSFLV